MFVKELQYAARSLSRAPRFTLACVFTLAFALAGTTTIVNLLEAFVFRQLAVSEPDQLIGIFPAIGEYSAGFSAPALQALTARQQVVTDICGVTAGYGTLSVTFDSGAARQRPVEAVTGNCYELLGLTAAVGRLIASVDAPPSGEPAPVVVISDRIWREEFAASPDVVGRIALCFVLAFVASLFSANLFALRQLPLGYEPVRLQWVQLNMVSRTAVVTPTIGYIDTLLSEIESLPDVELAAVSQSSFGRTRNSPDTVPVGRGQRRGQDRGAYGPRIARILSHHFDRIAAGPRLHMERCE